MSLSKRLMGAIISAAAAFAFLGNAVQAAPTPPGQPASGPGGADYPHGDWLVSQGGSGNDAWYVMEPINPKPASAPVAIFLHGYNEYSGYDAMYEFIRHTVRKGHIVIYPRWQTSAFNPGPNMEPALAAAVNGVQGAIAWLQADPVNRVQPELDKVGYLGHSFGGMIAANIANRHASVGAPAPKAVFLFEPHGGASGDQFDASMDGIPSTVKLNCQISQGYKSTDKGCFTLWPLLDHIPNQNKDFVVLYSDSYGGPKLVADHYSICSPPSGVNCYGQRNTAGPPDAMDFFDFWKTWDALQSCANYAMDCQYGLNDTPEHRHMGLWSDGTPVRELRITDTAQTP